MTTSSPCGLRPLPCSNQDITCQPSNNRRLAFSFCLVWAKKLWYNRKQRERKPIFGGAIVELYVDHPILYIPAGVLVAVVLTIIISRILYRRGVL